MMSKHRKEPDVTRRRIWLSVVVAILLAAAFGLWLMIDTPVQKQASPNTTDEVCGAFKLGVPLDQIPGLLGRNDGRENYWQAQRDSVWPIIEGQCG